MASPLCPSASLTVGPAGNRALSPAGELRNYLLTYPGGLPLEFWVNRAGVVVFVCNGPTRVLVLENVEKLG